MNIETVTSVIYAMDVRIMMIVDLAVTPSMVSVVEVIVLALRSVTSVLVQISGIV